MNEKGIIVDRNNSMELLSTEVFFPVLGKRLKDVLDLGTIFIWEYEEVYLLLNCTENKSYSATVFAELKRPHTAYKDFKSV